MARKRKAAKKDSLVLNQTADTVTFSKQGLIEEVAKFLGDEGACEGDWANKVKERFLGMKPRTVTVEFTVKGSTTVEVATDNAKPTVQEAQAEIRRLLTESKSNYSEFTLSDGDGNIDTTLEPEDLTVTDVK